MLVSLLYTSPFAEHAYPVLGKSVLTLMLYQAPLLPLHGMWDERISLVSAALLLPGLSLFDSDIVNPAKVSNNAKC